MGDSQSLISCTAMKNLILCGIIVKLRANKKVNDYV